MGSIRNELEKINGENESTQISIYRVWVLDKDENELLKFSYDLEPRIEVINTFYEDIDAVLGGPMIEFFPSATTHTEGFSTPISTSYAETLATFPPHTPIPTPTIEPYPQTPGCDFFTIETNLSHLFPRKTCK